MTPKEKAFELFNKYEKKLMYDYNDYHYSYNLEHCKQSALIAVDEIQQIIKDLSSCKNRFIYIVDEMNYWIEVKQEIEKL
jgi:hypothetical protein